MKKIISVLCIVFALILVIGLLSVSAAGADSGQIVLDNDRFYAVIPEGYKYESGLSSNYYYVNENYDSIEFYVLGNLMFPDGMDATDEETIKTRYSTFVMDETMSEIKISSAKKVKVNGLSAWAISGETSDGAFSYKFKTYILTTKETLYMITAQNETSFSDIDFLMKDFTINGTYFEGDVPTLEHDFSKSPKYIDALEKDVKSTAETNSTVGSGIIGAMGILGLLLLVYPIVIIILAVKYKGKKNEIKEFEKYCGTIYDVRGAVNTQYIQNSMNYNYDMNSNYNMNNNGAYGNSYAQPAPTNVQNDVSPEISCVNSADLPQSGSYPATEISENGIPVKNENEE